jgi:hypothetical protein
MLTEAKAKNDWKAWGTGETADVNEKHQGPIRCEPNPYIKYIDLSRKL